MRVSTSSFYSEPGCMFSISHKVDLFIRAKLTEYIMVPYGLDEISRDTVLSLQLTTTSLTVHVEARGPSVDKKNKFIVWGLWLPYKDIAQSENQLVPYLRYYFDALVIVFDKYNVKESDIRKVQKIVEEEVIDNPEYVPKERTVPKIDLSDLDL